jgi:Zn-dependent protease with chaperone function
MRWLLVLGALLLLASPSTLAQQPAPAPPGQAPKAAAQQPPQMPPEMRAPGVAEEKKPVTGFTLPPEKYEKAIEYAHTRYRVYFFDFVYGLLVLGAILALRVAPRFRDWAERVSQRRFVQVLVFLPLLALTIDLLGLPISIYRQSLALKYDQSIQGWPSWFWDWTKEEILSLILSVLIVWTLYAVIRRSPQRWWFYFWLGSLPMIVFLVFIAPVLIDPLFFQFTPLEGKRPDLVAEIEKVTRRGGFEIPRERMFEMNASTKRKSVNAYVTGIGASKRVVVWDTTLARTSTPQTLYIFGHEMGHYVLNHIPRTIAFLSVLLLVALYAGYHVLHVALRRWGERWAIRGADDWASLPVLLVFLSVFTFFGSPVINYYSRAQETEADVYGLEVIHDVVANPHDAAAESFQVLGEISLSDPDPHPLIKIWLYSHPPLNERIVNIRSYDPWSRGQPPKFVK